MACKERRSRPVRNTAESGEAVVTTVRLDPEVKEEANRVFADLGLSFSSGVDIYVRTVARRGCIPFTLDLNE